MVSPVNTRSGVTRSVPLAALSCLVAAAVLAVTIPCRATDLLVTVIGVRNDSGRVMVALHTEKPDVEFPDGKGVIYGQWRNARTGSVRFVFGNLAPGRFAVTAIHDEDGDGALDRTLFGIPEEGVGFSEDAIGDRGAPPFVAAAVDIGGDDRERRTQVTIRYR